VNHNTDQPKVMCSTEMLRSSKGAKTCDSYHGESLPPGGFWRLVNFGGERHA